MVCIAFVSIFLDCNQIIYMVLTSSYKMFPSSPVVCFNFSNKFQVGDLVLRRIIQSTKEKNARKLKEEDLPHQARTHEKPETPQSVEVCVRSV